MTLAGVACHLGIPKNSPKPFKSAPVFTAKLKKLEALDTFISALARVVATACKIKVTGIPSSVPISGAIEFKFCFS